LGHELQRTAIVSGFSKLLMVNWKAVISSKVLFINLPSHW